MPQQHLRADRSGWLRAGIQRLGQFPPAVHLLMLTALIVGIGLLLVQSSFAQRTARQTAAAEAEASRSLETVEQNLIDAETGQRGYLLTQDPAYLAPYDAARASIGRNLDDLQIKLGSTGDPQNDDRLRKISQLANAKMIELDQTVRFARNGNLDAAMILVRSNNGKATMDQLRQHLAALAVGLRQRRIDAFAAADRAEGWQIPLLLGMWLALLLMVWATLHSERRRAQAELAASHTDRLRDLNERNLLLAQELNHRVKNLFSVVLSMIGLAARDKGDTAQTLAGLSERIHGLSRAHSLAFGPSQSTVIDLHALLENVLEPYQDEAHQRITFAGESCGIVTRQLTPLALVLHELATNAAKYGALSVAAGKVAITWSCEDQLAARPLTTLTWREQGGPPLGDGPNQADETGGFGTKMTAAVLRQIDGTITREWPEDGVVVTVTFHRENPSEAGEEESLS
ncbi:MAG: CHASE3 domain-containing protein [Novosphingobium sp.]|uniref:sensor histidine kinase n=1 Tax=Novosphingobium sp. TaxID=1874826 RepID=UPI003C7B4225